MLGVSILLSQNYGLLKKLRLRLALPRHCFAVSRNDREKVDSSVLAMDCHALQSKARNDRKTPKAQNLFFKNAAGF